MTTITLIPAAPARSAVGDRSARHRAIGWTAAFVAGATLWTAAIVGVVAVVTALS